MKDVLIRYQMPEQFNVEVKTTYRGQRIGKDFLDENPKIAVLYPSYDIFMDAYLALKRETLQGMKSLLEVTENRIKKNLNIAYLLSLKL